MAAIISKRSSMMGGMALALCVLAQASFSSATEIDFEMSFAAPPFPQISLPELPPLPLFPFPPLPMPKLPQFSLPPLPSKFTIPGFSFPGFSIPLEKSLDGFHLPSIPQESFRIPRIPGMNLPAATFGLPPMPALRFPGFSYPPTPAETFTTPRFNPADFSIPGFTFRAVSVPATSFPFPRRALPRSQLKN